MKFEQTVLLRRKEDGTLENQLRVIPEASADEAVLLLDGEPVYSGRVCADEPVELWIGEPCAPRDIALCLTGGGKQEMLTASLRVPRHWEIHMIHMSHHDPGYTDLMSHVFQRHYEWIDSILDDMDARDDSPDDVRLRIAIEQFWSLDYYLTHAPADRVQKVIDRVKRGDIELTALYGNLITEQLGGEECYRAMYAAEEFARRCGVTITAATHNDIPGVSWGLCRALCDAGICYFAPDFPNYYDWGNSGLMSFWKSEEVFGYKGPGMCRWISPDGRSLLMWNGACGGGGTDGRFPWLESTLSQLEGGEYPYDLLRTTVGGSTVDNARFIPDYADNARIWNEKYAYPHIVISTNHRFFRAFEQRAQERGWVIPELRGDMPGQDYPVAAMSMAAVTSAARRTHASLTAAEKLLALTHDDPIVYDQTHLIRESYRDLLLADDHAYGYHFPAGPAMRASYWEKGTYAMRAEANAHDLMEKAMAGVADRIAPADSVLRLMVFNPSGKAGAFAVSAPMRELDNCGTIIRPGNRDPYIHTGYILNNRRHVNPEAGYWRDGLFELIDMETGSSVPYFIDTIRWDAPAPFAPERCGLASGGKRYGFFELPGGMKKMLCFIADDVPAFGYRCYALIPRDISPALPAPAAADELDNGIYRLRADERGICSLIDLRTGRELLDLSCPHRLGELLVRRGADPAAEVMKTTSAELKTNGLISTAMLTGEIGGAHEVRVELTMWQGLPKIELAVHLLHSAEPLTSLYAAFPFAGEGFRYEGMLCDLSPISDFVPGAQSDYLTTGSYVSVKGSGVVWSSADTAVVALGALWPGYVSPAHSCIFDGYNHRRLTGEDFHTGHIYAMLASNNYGTNFMCSQAFDGVYRFCFEAGAESAADWGESAQNPPLTQFTDRSRGENAPAVSLLDTGSLQCLTLKKAEDGRGFIARLWNRTEREQPVRIVANGISVSEFVRCDALERPQDNAPAGQNIAPDTVVTLRFDF